VAFNSIGWKSSNILFNAIDALLGDPLISGAFDGASTPSDAQAWIRNTPIHVSGDVTVRATQAAQLVATVGNEGSAEAELTGVLATSWATKGISGGGVLASNKVNTKATAFIEFTGSAGTVDAGGVVTIAASDAAAIESHATVVQSAVVTNTAQGLAQALSDLLPVDNDFTTKSGTRSVDPGSRVRIASDYVVPGVVAGHVYEFKGSAAESIDLGAEDYSITSRWTDLSVQPVLADFYPNIGNLTKSSARAIGILIIMNDVRATSEAYLDNALVTAASLAVTADEVAQILSEATSTVEASGGSFKGGGTVQAGSWGAGNYPNAIAQLLRL